MADAVNAVTFASVAFFAGGILFLLTAFHVLGYGFGIVKRPIPRDERIENLAICIVLMLMALWLRG